MMKRYDCYMICTSPRSGSTLLCSLLAATGVAGKPASWFYDCSVDDWLEDLGAAPKADATSKEVLDTVFKAAIRKGSGDNGPFGLRQQGESFPFLFEKLAELVPQETTDVGRFQTVFGPTLFIHLTRANKVDQAVSYLKAKQTGLWHVAPDGSELERVAAHQEPIYDYDRLHACVEMMEAYDCVWNEWFVREGVRPLVINYDVLASDPTGTLGDILGHLGLNRAAATDIKPGVKKLSDSINNDWSMRYRAERALV